MALPTLYEAMSSFYDSYIDALQTKSQRRVASITQDWQTINNNWNLYFQASAEGNSTGAATAIDNIVEILGGGIDISVLPNIGGTETERDGVVAVLAVAQKISFVADIGTTNYRLLLNITDASGVPVAYTLGALETDGFNITPSFPGTLWYNAKVITI